MINRWALLVAFFLSVFVGLIMTLPASIFVPERLNNNLKVKGSVFDGRAVVYEPVQAVLEWKLNRLSILWFRPSGFFSITGNGIDVQGRLEFRLSALAFERVDATIEPTLLNEWLRDEANIVTDNPVKLFFEKAVFSVSDRSLRLMTGELKWQGGLVQVLGFGGKPIKLEVPPLHGAVETSSNGIHLLVSESNGLEVSSFFLDRTGILTEVVLKQVQTWANVAFEGSESDILFKRQRRLYGRQ